MAKHLFNVFDSFQLYKFIKLLNSLITSPPAPAHVPLSFPEMKIIFICSALLLSARELLHVSIQLVRENSIQERGRTPPAPGELILSFHLLHSFSDESLRFLLFYKLGCCPAKKFLTSTFPGNILGVFNFHVGCKNPEFPGKHFPEQTLSKSTDIHNLFHPHFHQVPRRSFLKVGIMYGDG